MDIETISPPSHLGDRELLARVKRLAECERVATAELVASLAELDARRLYLGEGCSSMFTYCTQVLHLSEHAAYSRIEAARAARRFPAILPLLSSGDLTLTVVGLLAPHLTPENHQELLRSASHKSKRGVEVIVACLRPKPSVMATVRKLPEPRATVRPAVSSTDATAGADAASPPAAPHLAPPVARAVIAPLAPQRYKLQLTMNQATHEKLRRVQDLMRHRIPTGDPAEIFDRALTLLLIELERTKCAAMDRPRGTGATIAAVDKRTRHVPAVVRRAVWARDAGRCAFVGNNGRCTERGFLEFHHSHPYAEGGETTVANIELRCRAHNKYEKDLFSGQFESIVKESSAVYCAGAPRSGPSEAEPKTPPAISANAVPFFG
jgi:hypothetical protein